MTTLNDCYGFAHSLDPNVYAVVYLCNPHLSVTTLYRQILLALQVEPAFGFSRLLPQLRPTLSDLARKGRFVLPGQPDLAHKLRFAPFEALRQRIAFILDRVLGSFGPAKHSNWSPFAINR